jgi:hypothetical protein
MNDEPGKGERKHPEAARQDRLKLALRENLKRRKSQARGRDATVAGAEQDPSSNAKRKE